jgi:hypothetical protein
MYKKLLSGNVKGNELEMRLGKFGATGKFIPGIDIETFNNIYEEHKHFEVSHIETEEFIYDDGIKKVVSGDKTYWMKKTKLETVDEKEWNFRLSLSKEEIIEPVLNKQPSFIRKKKRTTYTPNAFFKLDMTEVEQKGVIVLECEIEFKHGIQENDMRHIIREFLKTLQSSNNIISNHQKESILKDYMRMTKEDRPNFVGAQAVNLTKLKLSKVIKNYAITDKADGLRNLLFITSASELVSINSKMEITKLMTLKSPEFNYSLIDCEFIDDKFLFFDLIFYKGLDLRTDEQYILKARLSKLVKIQELLQKSSRTKDKFRVKKYYFDKNPFEACVKILDNKPEYMLDGIILVPADELYSKKKTWSSLYKWKFPELNSVDLKIEKKNTKDNSYNITVFNGKNYVLFNPDVNGYRYMYIFKPDEVRKYTDGDIVEFTLKDKKLHPLRLRKDKIHSNFIDVAYDVFQDMCNPITENMIRNLAVSADIFKDINNIITGKGKKEDSPDVIFKTMRKFHNKIKEDVIEKVVPVETIISIGSGKGGDMNKWNKNGVKNVYGFDINDNYIQEAYLRLSNSPYKNKNYNFTKLDATSEIITLDVPVDAVESNFSLHYFLENKKSFDTFMSSVNQNLKNKGYFYGTILDGRFIHNNNKKNIIVKNKGDIMYSISKEYPYTDKFEKLPFFGNKITVELEAETLNVSTEFLVKFEELTEILNTKYGFKLIESKTFEDIYKTYDSKFKMEDYEKDYSFYGRTFIFQKTTGISKINLTNSLTHITADKIKWKESERAEGFYYDNERFVIDTLKVKGIINKTSTEETYKKQIQYIVIKFTGKSFDLVESSLNPEDKNSIFVVMIRDNKEKDYLLVPNKNDVFFTSQDYKKLKEGSKKLESSTLIDGKKYKDITVKELKEIAKKKNIKLDKTDKKEDIAIKILYK